MSKGILFWRFSPLKISDRMFGVAMSNNLWKKLKCSPQDLQLKATLTGGQSFRWKQAPIEHSGAGDFNESYIGVMANCVWHLRQDSKHLFYRILGELNEKMTSESMKVRHKVMPSARKKKSNGFLFDDKYYEDLLKAYFRMDTNLTECYQIWSAAHKHFEQEAGRFYAIRVLDQDPIENLFSFICSQNNHISRISSLVEKLCTNYGPKICDVNGIAYYAFPDYEALAVPHVEQELRNASFGYRAKFIQRAAAEIKEKGGLQWFQSIQEMKYEDAHAALMKLTGIGPKVADCICLMSLNHLEAIPVDTHVLKIATEYYLPSDRQTKSMTPKLYAEIGDAFRAVYGPLAGWAQTVLFCADLTKFKEKGATENGCSKPKKKRK